MTPWLVFIAPEVASRHSFVDPSGCLMQFGQVLCDNIDLVLTVVIISGSCPTKGWVLYICLVQKLGLMG